VFYLQVLFDYDAETEDEMTIREGQVVAVLDDSDGFLFRFLPQTNLLYHPFCLKYNYSRYFQGITQDGQMGKFPSIFVEAV